MVRIFLAFPLPLNLRKHLQQMFSGYSKAAGFRWTPEENLHITIYFIGEVEEEKIPLIREKIHGVLSQQTSFRLEFEQFEFRGHSKKPSMFWARFKKSEVFSFLSAKVASEVQQYMTIKIQHQDPIPHITIARLKRESNTDGIFPESFTRIELPEIDYAELWQTVHTPSGVKYLSLDRFDFGKKQKEIFE